MSPSKAHSGEWEIFKGTWSINFSMACAEQISSGWTLNISFVSLLHCLLSYVETNTDAFYNQADSPLLINNICQMIHVRCRCFTDLF